MRVVAVSEVTRYLKDLLEEDYYLQDLWIRGEVSNYSQAPSGHRYFSLKDERATLKCVLWRGAGGYLPALRNGMAVMAHGRFSVYEQRGDYQFYVDALEDAGIGELHLRFEQLKAQLDAEGLFAPERKRALPPSPAVIGVVTSASAAAFRDIVRTLRLRCPLVRVILAPTLVQGEGAAEQVAASLDSLNAHGEADVIIVARGGGSIEELWPFNEEVVARAIARSRIPVVTGVGHETDFSIADFVADLRASTPTAAAAAVVPDASAWRESLELTRARLEYLIDAQTQAERQRLRASAHNLSRCSPHQRIAADRQHVAEVRRALDLRLDHLLTLHGEHLRGSALRLHALSPLVTLGRGFAVVRRQSDGGLVASVAQVSVGQDLQIQVADGTFAAIAGPRLDAEPPDVAAPPASVGGSQGGGRRRHTGPATTAGADLLSDDGRE
jgi:exodeoxyribonuclease VII large subunit